MLTGFIRKHKSTQTLRVDQIPPTPRARSQYHSNRSERNHSPRTDIADAPNRSTLSVPVQGRSRSSTSEARSRFPDRNQSNPNRSHSSEPRAVDSEPTPQPTMPSQESDDGSASEVDARLHRIRTRAREASVRSLILTSRVHSIVQKRTLKHIRAQEA